MAPTGEKHTIHDMPCLSYKTMHPGELCATMVFDDKSQPRWLRLMTDPHVYEEDFTLADIHEEGLLNELPAEC